MPRLTIDQLHQNVLSRPGYAQVSSIGKGGSPVPECAAVSPLQARRKAEKGNSAFYFIRITSFRRRLLDTDNLVGKFHCDALRFAEIIHDDSAKTARIVTDQIKVSTEAEERTEIEIDITYQR